MATPQRPAIAVVQGRSSFSEEVDENTTIRRQRAFSSELSQAIRDARTSAGDPVRSTTPFRPQRLLARNHRSCDFDEKSPSDSLPAIPVLDPEAHADEDEKPDERIGHLSRKRFSTYFLQEVAHNHFLEAQLLALTVATGILDAMTFTQYSVFVSKQTGNTIFLALYASDHPSVAGVEKNVGTSIGAFVLGAAFFGHFGYLVKQRRRIWLLFSNAFQCVLVFAACAIRQWVSEHSRGPIAIAVIFLLSFACGGQISLALCVKLPELNTTMITGCLIQLATDTRIFRPKNEARDRRLLFYCSILAGAFVGAAATSHQSGTLAMLLCAIVKTLVGLTFLLNHGIVGGIREVPNSGTVTPLNRILWGD